MRSEYDPLSSPAPRRVGGKTFPFASGFSDFFFSNTQKHPFYAFLHVFSEFLHIFAKRLALDNADATDYSPHRRWMCARTLTKSGDTDRHFSHFEAART